MKNKGFITIGIGHDTIYDFISKVKSMRVNCIVDVRSNPYNRYNMSFCREELKDRLSEEGIRYFWLGNKLGGRYDKIEFCDDKGVVDYVKVAGSVKFKEGINELVKLFHTYNVCVMCSEQDPIKCHRFLLISRALKEYNIYHVMPDCTVIKNSELEKILFSKFGNPNQLSLFEDENPESFEDKAYRMQGKKTAYVSQKVKNMVSQGLELDEPDKIHIYCIGAENKTAEKFFGLLRENQVKRLVDVRLNNKDMRYPFLMYPDIACYLKMCLISYERYKVLIPREELEAVKADLSRAEYFNRHEAYVTRVGAIQKLVSDDMLEGTCFLGCAEDYHKCYRSAIITAIKAAKKNLVVHHLK